MVEKYMTSLFDVLILELKRFRGRVLYKAPKYFDSRCFVLSAAPAPPQMNPKPCGTVTPAALQFSGARGKGTQYSKRGNGHDSCHLLAQDTAGIPEEENEERKT
jgi:hypothetical protein